MRSLPQSLVLVASAAWLAACPPVPAGPSPTTPSKAVCGNNDRQRSEVCDGTDLDEQSCVSLGFGAGQLRCQANCQDFDRAGCGAPTGCGDGARAGVEPCDGGDLGTATCQELGYGAGSLGCLSNCAGFDTSACGPPPGCGDGDRDGVEVCDGQDFGGLRCRTLGFDDGELRCASDCLSIDSSGCTTACEPDCRGRVCGPDPVCGLSCGTCASGNCTVSGQCTTNCTPDCSGRECGPDPLCDTSCGSCDSDQRCAPEGVCVACSADCGGRECGPDPLCGQSCGSCASGTCSALGQCVCTPDCSGLACGPDPVCGASCGSCASGICVDGACQQNLLCEGYSASGRLGACEQSCGGPFSCVSLNDFTGQSACLDTRPCAATPAARCCGSGEFCGVAGGGLSMLQQVFCCVPGEVLGQGLLGSITCADGGVDIGCTSSVDCPTAWGLAHCATSLSPARCVECLQDSHCATPSAGCDTATGTCVQCTQHSHCSGATPACDVQSHTCVACTDESFCGGTTPQCSSSLTCVACSTDAHCTSPTADYCVSGACVECRESANCPANKPYCRYGNTCNACPNFHSCTTMADGSRACWPAALLEPSQHYCTTSDDCDPGAVCGAPTGKYRDCLIPCQ